MFVLTVPFPGVSVSTFDEQGLRLVRTTRVSAPPPLRDGWGVGNPLAVDTRTGRVFASHVEGNRVGMLDASSGRLIGTTALRPRHNTVGNSLNADPLRDDETLGRLYAVDMANGVLDTLDAANGRLLYSARIGGPHTLFAPVVDERARRLLAPYNGGLVVLDALSGRLLRRVPVAGVAAMAAPVAATRGGRVVLLDARIGTVVLLDGARLVASRPGLAGPRPGGLAVDEGSGRVLIADAGPVGPNGVPTGRGVVRVLDGATGATLGIAPVGDLPGAIVVDAQVGRALVFNSGGGTIPPPDPWGWVPAELRRRLPFIPAAPTGQVVPGSVTVLDTSRL